MVAILALLAQAIAQPYRMVSDHALAMCCDIVLVATLVWCFVLHFETFKEAVSGSLSEDMASGLFAPSNLYNAP